MLPILESAMLASEHMCVFEYRPAHAIYYAVYEEAKELFGGNTGTGHHPFATAAAGVLATVTGDAINLPLDVVKQRLQVRCLWFIRF